MTKLTVLPNSFLTLNYRLTLPSGDDYINTFIDRPATLLMGSGQFAPCFEKVLIEGHERGSGEMCPALPREMFDCYFKQQS
jgi:FKBP-type peptidyl-prolyl cis-trans isomerase SlpA